MKTAIFSPIPYFLVSFANIIVTVLTLIHRHFCTISPLSVFCHVQPILIVRRKYYFNACDNQDDWTTQKQNQRRKQITHTANLVRGKKWDRLTDSKAKYRNNTERERQRKKSHNKHSHTRLGIYFVRRIDETVPFTLINRIFLLRIECLAKYATSPSLYIYSFVCMEAIETRLLASLAR